MNALEIVGLACVDRPFRRLLFENVDAVILANRTDLTWAEEEGLRRITRSHRPKQRTGVVMAMKAGPDSAEGSGAEGSDDANSLAEAMEKVGIEIEMMCPVVPCAWPDSFTQNPPKPTS